jgi:hypothetical protein
VTERHALLDAIFIGGMHQGCASQRATALGTFALQKVPFARAGAQHLATGGYFEPLGGGFLSLNAFWTSHKIVSFEKSAQYRVLGATKQGLF